MVLAPLPVVIPLSVAGLLAAGNKVLPRRLADTLAALTAAATCAISLLLMKQAMGATIVYWFGGWTPRAGVALGISFAIGPFGAALAALTSLLVLAALLFSTHYFDSIGTLFHVLMLVFLGAMCGFSLTGDLFNLFVFFELMSAAAFALCGYKIEETAPLQGALNFAITNTVAAFAVLLGIGMLYARTGALNMAQIGRALDAQPDALVITAFTLIMCGFFVKGAVLPFHFWLADAHAVAPTPVCVLFSGVMVELGVYAVARVYWAILDKPFSAHHPPLTALLLSVGSATAIVGAIMAFGQRHIKRLLAFSTVSHVGLIVIGFALLRVDALAGAGLYVVGHGLVKASLFLISGVLLHRLQSVDEYELKGRACGLVGTGVLWAFAGLGLAGVPPFATFLGEAAIEDTASKAGHSWVAWIFFFSAALTAGAVFRVGGRVFLDMGSGKDPATATAQKIEEEPETGGAHHHIPAVMYGPALFLAVLALAVGLMPGIRQKAQFGATQFADYAGYQARVLDNAVVPVSPPPVEHVFPISSVGRSLGAAALALLLAWFALSSYWPRKERSWASPVQRVLYQVRRIHSGHVGDYVAFFTFGLVVFGIVLAVLIRGLGY